jgi:arylsulfatase A-like enzyme
MRILYLDIDTLRPDHMGCYGYHRRTSPNIDALAASAVRFDNCYVSDAPCLPSRASLFTGRFGIHNGAIGHGGTAADLRLIGPERAFRTDTQRTPWITALDLRDWHTTTFSTFAHRHSSWWFYAGFREIHNCGLHGHERADGVVPGAIEWLKKNGRRDNWLLHVHVWDPHSPYRTPADFGNPFENEPLDGWYTEERRRQQWDDFNSAGVQEPSGSMGAMKGTPVQPAQVRSMADYKRYIDSYDSGIAFADLWAGRLFNALADLSLLDDTIIMVSSDHGENFGELGVMGDHATADHITNRVPMILRAPGAGIATGRGGRVDKALHYQNDLAASILELVGAQVPSDWDGVSIAPSLRSGTDAGRPYLVASQGAWSCMRAVRWDRYMFLRSFHTGLKHLPAHMLFDVVADPHETNDLAAAQPQLADHAQALLEEWTTRMLAGNPDGIDPMWTVLSEGGPYHTRGKLADYCRRLRATGRAAHADFLEQHPTGLA